MAVNLYTAFVASVLPAAAAALGQSSAPAVCNLGEPCVVDSKGAFVGVGPGWGGPISHVFNGAEYLINGVSYAGLDKGGALFYFTTSDCSGQPYITDDSAIPQAEADTDGTLYAAKRPFANVKAGSFSFGLTGTCKTYPTIGNVQPLGSAYVVDHTIAKSWVPPFAAYERRQR
jgi:hypothetical protein